MPARIPPTGKIPQKPISKIDSSGRDPRRGERRRSAIVVVLKMMNTQAAVPTNSIVTGNRRDRPIDPNASDPMTTISTISGHAPAAGRGLPS